MGMHTIQIMGLPVEIESTRSPSVANLGGQSRQTPQKLSVQDHGAVHDSLADEESIVRFGNVPLEPNILKLLLPK